MSRKASTEEVLASFRRLSAAEQAGNAGATSERLERLREAFETLSDPARRAAADAAADRHQYVQQQIQQRSQFQYVYSHSLAPWVSDYLLGISRVDDSSARLTSSNFELLVAAPPAALPHLAAPPEHLQHDGRGLSVWLVYAFGHRCEVCDLTHSVWREALRSLAGTVRTGFLHNDFEGDLARQLGVRRVPAVIVIAFVDGQRWLEVLPMSSGQLQAADIVAAAARQFERVAIVEELSEARSTSAVSSKLVSLAATAPLDGRARVVVFSHSRSRAHVLFRYLAAVFRDAAQFYHVSLKNDGLDAAHIGAALGVEREVAQGQTFLVVLREPGAPRSVLTSPPRTAISLQRRLAPLLRIRLPKLTTDNFFPLCYEPSEEFASTLPGAGNALRSRAHLYMPDQQRICLIVFARNAQEAHARGQPLVDERSPLSSMLANGRLQLGWISPAEEARFFAYFEAPRAAAVLLRAAAGTFVAASAEDAADLARWAADVLSAGKAFKPPSSEQRRLDGLPFLEGGAASPSSLAEAIAPLRSALGSIVGNLASVAGYVLPTLLLLVLTRVLSGAVRE